MGIMAGRAVRSGSGQCVELNGAGIRRRLLPCFPSYLLLMPAAIIV